MSKRTLDDTDYWDLDQIESIQFVPTNEIISILVNGKYIGQLIKMFKNEQLVGISLMFDHLIKTEACVFGDMLRPIKDLEEDCFDFFFDESKDLKYYA